MYIAIACFRSAWLHAKREDGVGLCCKLQTFIDDTLKFIDVEHEVVTWCDHDIGLGVFGFDSPTHVGYAWSRVAAAWL